MAFSLKSHPFSSRPIWKSIAHVEKISVNPTFRIRKTHFVAIFIAFSSVMLFARPMHQIYLRKKNSEIIKISEEKWLKKNHGDKRSIEKRLPEVIEYSDKRCVRLDFKEPSIGGIPEYCYKVDSNETIYEVENVY